MYKENYKELPFFVPNDIFQDFKKMKFTSKSHYSFAICYYILVSYLYYTAHYGWEKLTQSKIKKILGYSPTNKTIDYIIKQNGLMDQLEYTFTTTNYPVLVDYDSYPGNEVILISDADPEVFNTNDRNFTVKHPIKGVDETFSCVKNTTKIDMRIFDEIISDSSLGCAGFLIYIYVKYQGSLRIGYEQFAKILMMSERNLKTKIKSLEKKGYILVKHEKYDFTGKKCLANCYNVKK